jgi:hypothetical protein
VEELFSVGRGEHSPITLIGRRRRSGIYLSVEASPEVEEYIKSLTPGPPDYEQVDLMATAQNGNWIPYRDSQLIAYPLQRSSVLSSGLGQDLVLPQEPGNRYNAGKPNISWLRLVGISRPGGITFQIKGGVNGPDGFEEAVKRCGKAAHDFYLENIQPVDVIVEITNRFDRGQTGGF